ncbi:hypothetical protein [Streptomyces sp. CLI2509]|uniref:hypothetical protein n=1 Tax=Streptomyces sp. CLI2509 TaxID=1984801 RepID=UPI001F3B8730|nr:hypothetical protein [Streptomyces sp. CLI2509]
MPAPLAVLVAPALQRLRDGRVPGGPLEGEDRARGADGAGRPGARPGAGVSARGVRPPRASPPERLS